MPKIPQRIIHDYLRHDKKFPHVWCSGCSNGIVLGAVIRAIDELKLDRDNIVMVSGIGCSSRMPVYVDFNTLHTLHGRAISYATGVKMYKPGMKVIVITGDGDSTAIGGNHLIHAARRNLDLTVIVLNNNIYGMTGGQFSPTTPEGDTATTAPYGNIDTNFDICKLVIGAGASHVARSTAFHAMELQGQIKDALTHDGFSLVEAICACPVIYGKLNKKGTPAKMMMDMRDNTIPIKAAAKMKPEQVAGKTLRGTFVKDDRIEYSKAYQKVIDYAQGKDVK
ncbi:MAG: 2-oxoacid:ferredoxin oxidoreductase subunit beta [Candidatus Cloacimonetes bacterium 4572_65]|nr:MAG: 2-oxoacid:ferredoxin oxidoreductase subunit beta [Candidatus Cloacimonetes bacterium 4572_65]